MLEILLLIISISFIVQFIRLIILKNKYKNLLDQNKILTDKVLLLYSKLKNNIVIKNKINYEIVDNIYTKEKLDYSKNRMREALKENNQLTDKNPLFKKDE